MKTAHEWQADHARQVAEIKSWYGSVHRAWLDDINNKRLEGQVSAFSSVLNLLMEPKKYEKFIEAKAPPNQGRLL